MILNEEGIFLNYHFLIKGNSMTKIVSAIYQVAMLFSNPVPIVMMIFFFDVSSHHVAVAEIVRNHEENLFLAQNFQLNFVVGTSLYSYLNDLSYTCCC